MNERAQALEAALRRLAQATRDTLTSHRDQLACCRMTALCVLEAEQLLERLPIEAPAEGVSSQPDEHRDGNYYGEPLTTAIKDSRLVISIGVQTLAHAIAFANWANPFDEAADDYIRTFAIEDASQFAKDVVSAMLSEREDGSTPLSDFIDQMAQDAIEDGSLGLHEDEQQIKHGTFAACETWATTPAPVSTVEPTPPKRPVPNPMKALLKFLEPLPPVEPTPDHPAEAQSESLTAPDYKRFAERMFALADWPEGGDVDGFAFQDAAVECGLLLGETRYAPCGETCWCADSALPAEFDAGVTCYRRVESPAAPHD